MRVSQVVLVCLLAMVAVNATIKKTVLKHHRLFKHKAVALISIPEYSKDFPEGDSPLESIREAFGAYYDEHKADFDRLRQEKASIVRITEDQSAANHDSIKGHGYSTNATSRIGEVVRLALVGSGFEDRTEALTQRLTTCVADHETTAYFVLIPESTAQIAVLEGTQSTASLSLARFFGNCNPEHIEFGWYSSSITADLLDGDKAEDAAQFLRAWLNVQFNQSVGERCPVHRL